MFGFLLLCFSWVTSRLVQGMALVSICIDHCRRGPRESTAYYSLSLPYMPLSSVLYRSCLGLSVFSLNLCGFPDAAEETRIALQRSPAAIALRRAFWFRHFFGFCRSFGFCRAFGFCRSFGFVSSSGLV